MKPLAAVTGDSEITSLFAFPSGRHAYQITYEAFIRKVGEGTGLLEIKSEPVSFSFDK